jgi:hypothetical protein
MQKTLKTITKNMKQEEKDHLLNDKNLSAEEQAEVKRLLERLDALNVERNSLISNLKEITKGKNIDFHAALSSKRIEELKEARFRKFLSEKPIWEESYAAFGRDRTQVVGLVRAQKEAVEFVEYFNPQFDFDDILDQITE